jgi:hypothetical protein
MEQSMDASKSELTQYKALWDSVSSGFESGDISYADYIDGL